MPRLVAAAALCLAAVTAAEAQHDHHAAAPRKKAAPSAAVVDSAQFGLWQPSARDTCSKAVHDAYAVLGPDGKRYHTWHPPVDPKTGCRFGHEHGADPKGSKLWSAVRGHFAPPSGTARAGLPFGYANEQLDLYAAATGTAVHRHEDHVGHKIEWGNDVPVEIPGPNGRQPTGITCSYLAKVHQGTHSPDAFAMNLHEVVYFARCSDGLDIRLTQMAAFGAPGEFTRSCADGERGAIIDVEPVSGAPPPYPGATGFGQREIFDAYCALKAFLVPEGRWSSTPYEIWSADLGIPNVVTQLSVAFAVFDPIRFYDPARPSGLARTIELCTAVEPNGDRARGGPCASATDNGRITDITWDDPRSPFRGAKRETYFKAPVVANRGGPTARHTDPFGGSPSATPFPGSIRQYVSAVDRNYSLRFGRPIEPTALGKDRPYGVPSVHAPN